MARKPTKAELGRMLMNSGWTEDELNDPEVLAIRRQLEQEAQEEEARKNADFSQVKGSFRRAPTPPPAAQEEPSWFESGMGSFGDRSRDVSQGLRSSLAGGLQRSLGGLLTISADLDATPGVMGDLVRWEDQTLAELAPEIHGDLQSVRDKLLGYRTELVRRAEENQKVADASVAGARTEVGRQSLEAISDFAGSPISALSVIGGPVSAGITGLDVYGQEYMTAEMAGVDPETARRRATAMAGIEGGVSAIPAGQFLSRIPGVRNVVGRVGRDLLMDDAAKLALRTGRTVAGEAAEEGLTEAAQIGVDAGIAAASDDSEDVQFAAQNTVDFWNQVWRATKAGAVGGAALGTPHNSLEISAEAGRLASQAKRSNESQRRGLANRRDAERARMAEDARVADERARVFQARENEIAVDEQLRADQEEAAYRTMERQRQADALRRGASLDQVPGPMQAGFQNVSVTPVTAEDIAAERRATSQQQVSQQAEGDALVQRVQAQQDQAARAEVQKLIDKDTKGVEKKATTMRNAARRTAMKNIMDSTRGLEGEERITAVQQGIQEWETANPLSDYLARATAPKAAKRTPTQGTRRPTRTVAPAPVTEVETEEEAGPPPKRDFSQIKKELGLSSAQTANVERGVTSEQALQTLTDNVAKGDAKKVLKLIADGNAVIIDGEQDVPEGSVPAGSGAYYDGERTYIVASGLDKNNVMGDLLKFAAHEVKHAADVSGNKTLKATMGQFIGDEANAQIVKKIEALAANGNPLATEVVEKAKANSDPSTYAMELPAYWMNAAMEARELTGAPRRVAQDIVSAVRTKYKALKGDADINLDDVGYMGRKLLEEAGLSGERLEGEVPEALPTIAGKTATGLAEARKAGFTYKSVDGNEKFLFSDAESVLQPTSKTGWKANLVTGKTVPIEDVLDHKEFYKQYPDAKNIKVRIDQRLEGTRTRAYFDTDDDTVYFHPSIVEQDQQGDGWSITYTGRGDEQLHDILTHEMQHYIQRKEGHATGGAPSMFFTKEDEKIVDKYNETQTKLDGFMQLFVTPEQRRRVFGEGGLEHFIKMAGSNIQTKKISRMEGLSDIAEAISTYNGNVSQQARIIGRGLALTLESMRNLGGQVDSIFDRQYKQYLSLLGEVEARYASDMRTRQLEDLPINPEDLGMSMGSRPLDTNVEDVLLGSLNEDGSWSVKDREGNIVIDSTTVATQQAQAPRTNMTPKALASATGRFQQPTNRAATTIKNAITAIGGQLKTYGNLGKELGVMKEEADGEAALHSHRAMNYFNWLNRGISRMARAGVKTGKYQNRTEGEEAIREMIRTKMDQIAEIPEENRREAALSAFVRQNPELDGLMAAVQEVRQLSRTLLKQMVMTTETPTNEELRLMNTIMDNSFRYTTQMYAAFQGEAGRIHSQAIINDYDAAIKALAKGRAVPEKVKDNFRTYKNAMKYLIDNDLTIPEIDELDSSSTKKLQMLYDSWIGDATRLSRTTKERGIRDGLTIRQADQLVRDTLIAALDEKRPGISDTDYEGKARDLILGMLELSNEGGPFASYYRGFKQDRSILERRTGLPEEIKELFGEIKDPATRLAVTIAKQGELAARTRMLLNMRDNGTGKWVIPPEQAGLPGNEKFTATLKGKNYGPLDGYRTTPEIASAISDNLELFSTLTDAMAQSYQNSQPAIEAAARFGVGKLRGAAAWQKILSVVFDLYNMGTNFLGSFIALGANGLPVKGFWKSGKVALDVIADSVYTKAGELSPGFEDAVRYGILDSARVQEIRKTPQKYVKELISVQPKAVGAVKQGLGKLRAGTVETFAMSDAWVKIAAFNQRVAHLNQFYKAEGIEKSEDDIKKEAASQIKDTNITYSRTPPLVRNLESVGVTTFMPYFVSVPRAIMHNLVLGIQDTVRATDAKTAKGKALMMQSGIRRITGAYASSAGLVMLTKALAAAFNDDDDDEVQEMEKLMYPDARFADSFYLGNDAAKNPMFARFSRIDPFGPANDLLRIAVDDTITPEEKRRHMIEMLKDMVITNRVVVAGLRLGSDVVADEDLINKKTKIERIAPQSAEKVKEWLGKIPGLDYSDTESIVQFADSFTPGFADAFDPKNRGVADPKGTTERVMGDVIMWSGGRMDVAEPGLAAFRVGKEVEAAREEGRSKLAAGVAAGRSPQELARVFVETAAKEQTAMQEARRAYEGMVNGVGLTPRQASEVLKEQGNLTQSDIANIRSGRVNQELEEWLNGGTRMLSKSSLKNRSDEGLSEEEKKAQKEQRKAFVEAMRALGYKVREN